MEEMITEDLTRTVQSQEASIRFDIRLDDIAVYSGFNYARSTAGKVRFKKTKFNLFLAGALIGISAGLISLAILPPALCIGFGALLALISMAIFYFQIRQIAHNPKFFLKRVTEIYSKGYENILLCEHRLSVNENGFIDKTAHNEAKYSWASLDRIETEPDFTYLFVSPTSAIIIPHKNIVEGDLSALLNAIKTYYQPECLLKSA